MLAATYVAPLFVASRARTVVVGRSDDDHAHGGMAAAMTDHDVKAVVRAQLNFGCQKIWRIVGKSRHRVLEGHRPAYAMAGIFKKSLQRPPFSLAATTRIFAILWYWIARGKRRTVDGQLDSALFRGFQACPYGPDYRNGKANTKSLVELEVTICAAAGNGVPSPSATRSRQSCYAKTRQPYRSSR